MPNLMQRLLSKFQSKKKQSWPRTAALRYFLYVLFLLVTISLSMYGSWQVATTTLPAVATPYPSLVHAYFFSWYEYVGTTVLYVCGGAVVLLLVGALLRLLVHLVLRKLSFVQKLLLKLTFLRHKLVGLFGNMVAVVHTVGCVVAIGLVIGWLSGLAVTVAVAKTNLAQLAQSIEDKPSDYTIVTDLEKIGAKLVEQKELPLKVSSGETFQSDSLLKKVAIQRGYSAFVVETVPVYFPQLTPPAITLPVADMLLVDTELVVTKVSESAFEKIAPQLALRLITSYFPDKPLPNPPKIDVISRQEYLSFRDDLINQQLKEIEKQISSIGGQISSKRSAQWDIFGKYISGELSYDDAKGRHYALEAQIASLSERRGQLTEAKKFVAAQKEDTPQELGMFLPADTELKREEEEIKVVLDTTSQTAINDYLAVLVHEYLHFASYVDDERRLLPFFEEGLTEYFTRTILAEKHQTETEVGYVLIEPIVAAMTAKVGKDKMQEVYFTKDEKLLAQALDASFGEDFYSDSEFHFVMMSFVPAEDAHKMANDLLNEIDAKPLKSLEEILAR